MSNFDFLTDDWKKIPQNLRFLVISGGFLIFNSWLLDHWGRKRPYLLWNWDVRSFGYSLGLTLILIALGLLVAKQFIYFGRIIYFRKMYPINKLNLTYYLVWFNGTLYLFDKKPKKYYHVLPWETAQDLLFVGKGIKLPGGFSNEVIPIPNSSKSLDPKKYSNGGNINTQI